jgi:hypothetical protein
VLRPALVASWLACLPAREMTYFHMWPSCSITPVRHCQKPIPSQLPQFKYNWLPRWLAAHLPCQTTHLLPLVCSPEKSYCLVLGNAVLFLCNYILTCLCFSLVSPIPVLDTSVTETVCIIFMKFIMNRMPLEAFPF